MYTTKQIGVYRTKQLAMCLQTFALIWAKNMATLHKNDENNDFSSSYFFYQAACTEWLCHLKKAIMLKYYLLFCAGKSFSSNLCTHPISSSLNNISCHNSIKICRKCDEPLSPLSQIDPVNHKQESDSLFMTRVTSCWKRNFWIVSNGVTE